MAVEQRAVRRVLRTHGAKEPGRSELANPNWVAPPRTRTGGVAASSALERTWRLRCFRSTPYHRCTLPCPVCSLRAFCAFVSTTSRYLDRSADQRPGARDPLHHPYQPYKHHDNLQDRLHRGRLRGRVRGAHSGHTRSPCGPYASMYSNESTGVPWERSVRLGPDRRPNPPRNCSAPLCLERSPTMSMIAYKCPNIEVVVLDINEGALFARMRRTCRRSAGVRRCIAAPTLARASGGRMKPRAIAVDLAYAPAWHHAPDARIMHRQSASRPGTATSCRSTSPGWRTLCRRCAGRTCSSPPTPPSTSARRT